MTQHKLAAALNMGKWGFQTVSVVQAGSYHCLYEFFSAALSDIGRDVVRIKHSNRLAVRPLSHKPMSGVIAG